MTGVPDGFDAALHGTALREAKLALRRQVLAARDLLSPGIREQAAAEIAARLNALPSFQAARTVLLTLPFRGEWDTLPLVRAALDAGQTVVVPRVNVPARMLDLYAIADPLCDVAPGHNSIPEPLAHCRVVAPEEIDWVLVPGVTFDRTGRRLGYGGGYYDRLLPSLPAQAPRIAGAFSVQIVDRVPAGPHDAYVDAIITEAEVILPAGR